MAVTKKERGRRVAKLFFIGYLILLGYYLFFAESLGRTSASGYHYNLQPFAEIKRFLYHIDILGWKTVFLNLGGNIIGFMPFGYFVPRTSKKKVGLIYTVFLGFEFSFLIEGLQLIFEAGSFDVDDLILNTVGALLGYVVYFIMHGIKASRKD